MNNMFKVIDKNNCIIEVEGEKFIYNVPSAGIYRATGTPSDLEKDISVLPGSLSIENIKEIIRYNKEKNIGLETMSLILTGACNLRCRYCFEGNGKNTKMMTVETALEAVKLLLDEARSDGKRKSLNFFGGEPLLNFEVIREIAKVVMQAREQDDLLVDMSITTNFTLMNDEMFELIDRADISLLVSIDGDKSNHDSQRIFKDGSGTYDYLVRKIDKYIGLRPDLFMARATVTSGNMNFTKLTEDIRSLGFETVYFSIDDCFSKHRTTDRIIDITKEYEEGYGEYIKSVYKRIESGDNNILFIFYDVLESLWNRNLHFVPCHIGAGYVAVDPEKKVYACQRLVNSDKAKTYPLEKLKSRKKLFSARTVHEKKHCPECWARYLCSGGCPALSIEQYGNDMIPDTWRCEIRKIEIKWLLWLFVKLLKNGHNLNDLYRK